MARAKYLVIWNNQSSGESGAFYASWLDYEQIHINDPFMQYTIVDRIRDMVSFDGGIVWNDIENT